MEEARGSPNGPEALPDEAKDPPPPSQEGFCKNPP